MGSCLSSETRNHLPGSPTTPLGGARKNKGLRKRLGSRNSSFDYRMEEQLHRIPGRMFVNGSSQVASLFTQQGKKGTNQDAMIVWENFGSRTDTIFCGVFDGHGPYGHMVAKRVRDSLPLKLSAHWEVKIRMGSMNSEATCLMSADEVPKVLIDLEDTNGQQQFFQRLKESFLKAFKVMDRELKVYGNIDCFCSGTTAVTLVKQGQDLVIGNVGDSRAVLGTRGDDGQLVPVQLTVDLKPNLPAEMERIRKCKGRVFSLKDEPEVARVWLPNNDSPGLAMARAFGDFCLKDFGLISVPDISYRRLTEKDEFIVLATDGIWDVLSNEKVVKIVASAPTRASASRKLVESAVCGWKMKYPTSKVDDCAVVCLFLDADSNNVSTASVVNSNENNMPTCSPSSLIPVGAVGNDREGSGEGDNQEAPEYEGVNTELGIEWSALEGVSRVNTMLTLPRFVTEK